MNAQRNRLVMEVREGIPAVDRAVTPTEVEFLLTYRRASPDDKRRMDKVLHAAGKGLLPSVEESNAMTMEQRREFADALPEVTP